MNADDVMRVAVLLLGISQILLCLTVRGMRTPQQTPPEAASHRVEGRK